jgi:hypothetical protein
MGASVGLACYAIITAPSFFYPLRVPIKFWNIDEPASTERKTAGGLVYMLCTFAAIFFIFF